MGPPRSRDLKAFVRRRVRCDLPALQLSGRPLLPWASPLEGCDCDFVAMRVPRHPGAEAPGSRCRSIPVRAAREASDSHRAEARVPGKPVPAASGSPLTRPPSCVAPAAEAADGQLTRPAATHQGVASPASPPRPVGFRHRVRTVILVALPTISARARRPGRLLFASEGAPSVPSARLSLAACCRLPKVLAARCPRPVRSRRVPVIRRWRRRPQCGRGRAEVPGHPKSARPTPAGQDWLAGVPRSLAHAPSAEASGLCGSGGTSWRSAEAEALAA